MDNSLKILLTVFFEALFLFNIVSLIIGWIRLKKSGAALLYSKTLVIQCIALAVFSLLAQAAFILFVVNGQPNFYILSMVSAFSALYPKIMSEESLFGYTDREIWFGFHSYQKGTVKPSAQDLRRKNLNVLMKTDTGKTFVLRTTPELWEKINTYL